MGCGVISSLHGTPSTSPGGVPGKGHWVNTIDVLFPVESTERYFVPVFQKKSRNRNEPFTSELAKDVEDIVFVLQLAY